MERRLAPAEIEGNPIGLAVIERGQGSLAAIHGGPPSVVARGTVGLTSV
jgi:hypothetical protein